MAAPLVPLSQQVWCWGAPRGGADGGCRGKEKTSRKRGSRGPWRRRRALKARKAEWRGPGGSEGDRPARPRVLLRRLPPAPERLRRGDGARPLRVCSSWGLARLCVCGGVFYEPRRASSPRWRARAVGPPPVFVSLGVGRRGGWCPRVKSQGDPGHARLASSRPALFPPGAASAALRPAKSAAPTPPTVGSSLRPQSRWMFFLSISNATGTYRKAVRRPLCF